MHKESELLHKWLHQVALGTDVTIKNAIEHKNRPCQDLNLESPDS